MGREKDGKVKGNKGEEREGSGRKAGNGGGKRA